MSLRHFLVPSFLFISTLTPSFAEAQINPGFIDAQVAVEQAIEENLKIPEPDKDGRIQTLNNQGAMSPLLDPMTKAFIGEAIKPGSTVLDIGAAYGLACMEALKGGAKDYTANDADVRHLKILARLVSENHLDALPYLKLSPGSFPEGGPLLESHYDAILIARVLHFMNPEQAAKTVQAIAKLLKPGGHVYSVMLSPYVAGFSPFIPEFEKRVKEGHPSPGYVTCLKDIADTKVVDEKALSRMNKPFFFFDVHTAKALFEKAGLEVVVCKHMSVDYQSKIWQLDGRENVGIIARKPML